MCSVSRLGPRREVAALLQKKKGDGQTDRDVRRQQAVVRGMYEYVLVRTLARPSSPPELCKARERERWKDGKRPIIRPPGNWKGLPALLGPPSAQIALANSLWEVKTMSLPQLMPPK